VTQNSRKKGIRDIVLSKIFMRVAAIAVAASGAFFAAASVFAAGTPENAVVIIDPSNSDSMYVGNYYKRARNIPDSNVLYMSSTASTSPDYFTFVATNQAAFTGSLGQRGITDHADYVVLAPVQYYFVPVQSGLIPDNCISYVHNFSISAVYTMAQISGSVTNGVPSSWGNGFGGGGDPYNLPPRYPSDYPALAFHAQQAYVSGSPSDGSTGWGQQYFIGALLGYTQGSLGNTVPELLTMIDNSVNADGTRPAGTFYFMNNLTDSARNVRACNGSSCSNPTIYNSTASSISALGGSAQVLSGILPPTNTTGVMGVMSGFAIADIPGANLGLVPGAFADELTSTAASFDCTNGAACQTTTAAWIAAGASGSAGSVEEPCAIVQKFPSADFHRYYYQGMSLGESYLRSVEWTPFQMVLYGDPLTRPFAYIPTVSVTNPPVGTQSGIITITPTATTTNPGAAIASYDLLVDGVKMSSANFGQSFTLDTQQFNDGAHDLRVLAYDNTAVQNVGRWIGTLNTSNYGHLASMSRNPGSGNLIQPFSFTYSATGGTVREVQLLQNGRVLAASAAANDTLSVYGQNLGAGISKAQVEAWYTDNRVAWSSPISVAVTSTGTPAGAAPIAYSYSKILTAPTAYLVELPASYDADPSTATYTLLNNPTQATLVQSGLTGPYRIIQALPGATGSEPLQFQVTTPAGTSSPATVTLVYTSTTTIAPPTGSTFAGGWAGNATQQVGSAGIGGTYHASLWTGTADSWVDLSPAGATLSYATGAAGGQQVGYAQMGIGGPIHGGLWTGTAASWVDLTPAGSPSTLVTGVSAGQQVGYVEIVGANGSPTHAYMWTGTAASGVDLSPTGMTESGILGTGGYYQVGFASVGSGPSHASLWTGSTAASWIDLHPIGATDSNARAAFGTTQQVGDATINGASHASLWTGTAASWVDLNPAGAIESIAYGTIGSEQVGYAWIGGSPRASLWSGTAASWVDLSAFLPPGYTDSYAFSITRDANGTYVIGQAGNSSSTVAVLWKIH
jgi:hypothetical protein